MLWTHSNTLHISGGSNLLPMITHSYKKNQLVCMTCIVRRTLHVTSWILNGQFDVDSKFEIDCKKNKIVHYCFWHENKCTGRTNFVQGRSKKQNNWERKSLIMVMFDGTDCDFIWVIVHCGFLGKFNFVNDARAFLLTKCFYFVRWYCQLVC